MIYAIGDIHGQYQMLREAHALIREDRARHGNARAPVVHVGDFVDRGPDVKATLDHLIDGQNRGEPWICLKGNHDRMMQAYLQQPMATDPFRPDLYWLADVVGGRQTLTSYGIDPDAAPDDDALHAQARAKVPDTHVRFLRTLPTSYRWNGVFFCHAGIRPGVSLSAQSEDDLLWIRKEFLEDRSDHGALIVHGHTPVQHATHYGNHINIDSGAGYGRAMSVIVIEENGAVFALNAFGRAELTPGGD